MKKIRVRRGVSCVGLFGLLLWLIGCEQIASVDRSKIDQEGSGGGTVSTSSAGSAGSPDTTSSMTGGSTSSGGGGTGGVTSSGGTGGVAGMTNPGGGGTGGGETTSSTSSSSSSSTTNTCDAGQVPCADGTCIPCPSAPEVHKTGVCNANNSCSDACEPGWKDCNGGGADGCETQGSGCSGYVLCSSFTSNTVTSGNTPGFSWNLNAPVGGAAPTCLADKAVPPDGTVVKACCQIPAAQQGNVLYLAPFQKDSGNNVYSLCQSPVPNGNGQCSVAPVELLKDMVSAGVLVDPSSPAAPFAFSSATDPVQLTVTLP